MPVPLPDEVCLGGHEVVCFGYDMPTNIAICQNSYGDAWGDHGDFYMPLEVLASPFTDLWIIHTGGPW